jgi:hypothetical protein
MGLSRVWWRSQKEKAQTQVPLLTLAFSHHTEDCKRLPQYIFASYSHLGDLSHCRYHQIVPKYMGLPAFLHVIKHLIINLEAALVLFFIMTKIKIKIGYFCYACPY